MITVVMFHLTVKRSGVSLVFTQTKKYYYIYFCCLLLTLWKFIAVKIEDLLEQGYGIYIVMFKIQIVNLNCSLAIKFYVYIFLNLSTIFFT